MDNSHKHCYVFEFPVTRRDGTGILIEKYGLLTNITGHKNPQNREWLEQGIRMSIGYYPKGVKYKYDKYA
jgi:hypothetical protein